MYIPGFFKENDVEAALNFMKKNPLAALVAVQNELPVASHLVLDLQVHHGSLLASGHMAKSNPLWKSFSTDPEKDLPNTKKVLLIFSGPNTYISPRWYNHTNVPTWNYIAVHAYGVPSVISSKSDLDMMMDSLISEHEKMSGYSFHGIPGEFRDKQMEGLVGFQIRIDRLEASYKLSQNRNDEDYQNIIKELELQTDQNSHEIAFEMRKKRKNSLK